MGTNKKDAGAARRARIEEMRRAEQARERRMKIITRTALAAVLAGTLSGGWYLWSAAEEKERDLAAPVTGEKTWDALGRDHVQKNVDYAMSPAAGGNHHPMWADCDATVYTKEVKEENAVHSLEHGAVWITYNDTTPEADVKALSDRVSTTPYTFLSPYGAQSAPITLTAWGHQLTVEKAADPRVDTFLSKYVQGEQTPEQGATCTGGSMR